MRVLYLHLCKEAVLLAAIPPWFVAALHDFTGTYKAGWIFHLCSVILVIVLVVRLAPRSYNKIH